MSETSGARSRALALMLAEQRPQQVGFAEAPDARDLLANHGADAVVQLIFHGEDPDAKQLTREPANRFLVQPRTARKLRQHLATGADEAFAWSHAVSPDAQAALRRGDVLEFLRTRRETLRDIEEQRATQVGLDYRR